LCCKIYVKDIAKSVQEEDESPGNPVKGALKVVEAAGGVPGSKYSIEQFARFLAGEADLQGKPSTSKVFDGKELPFPSSKKVVPTVEASTTEEAVRLGKTLMNDILCLDDCATNSKGERPLLPVNFVSTPKGIIIDHDQVLVTDKDGSLKVKPSKHKPTPDKITVGQWIAANARIQAKLMPTFSPQDLIDYLDYTRKIGDLLNQFTHSSVFLVDNDHRVDVNHTDRRWNDIDCSLELYYLRKKDEGSHNSMYSPPVGNTASASGNSRRQQSSQQSRASGGVCWDYNSADGCKYGDTCRYLHQDAPPNQRAPRFQRTTSAKGAL
jgi:hypothetical protein